MTFDGIGKIGFRFMIFLRPNVALLAPQDGRIWTCIDTAERPNIGSCESESQTNLRSRGHPADPNCKANKKARDCAGALRPCEKEDQYFATNAGAGLNR